MSKSKPDSNAPIRLDVNKPSSGKSLFDHQKKAIEQLTKCFIHEDKQAGLLQIPTGGGKTFTAVYWIFKMLIPGGYKLVWIAHRKDLLEQAREEMKEQGGLLRGMDKGPRLFMIGAGYNPGTTLAASKEEILLLSIQSIARDNGERALMAFCKKNRNNKVLFVIDEAHHGVAHSYKVMIERDILRNKNFKLLGLTATPTRTAENEIPTLWRLFEHNKIYEVSTNELIKKDILAKPIPEKIQTEIELEKAYKITEQTRKYFETRHELEPDFLEKIGMHSVRNKLIVGTYLENKEKYGKTLVFAIDIKHCHTLQKEFEKHKKIRSDYTFSGKENHSEIVEKFKKGELDVLINISKLTEGFDDPKIQTIFLTRPTQSEILFTQMVGRGLRGGVKGTKEAYLVSFEDHWDQFTGWLDPNKYMQISGIEEVEKDLRPARPTIKHMIPFMVIEELYREIRSVLPTDQLTSPSFECWPLGWYSLQFDSEGSDKSDFNIPITRTILVFSHQKRSWDELCKSLTNSKPSSKKIDLLYDKWFADLPSPSVSREIVDLFVQRCYASGKLQIPEFFPIKDRDSASPDKLAEMLYHKSIGGPKRKGMITEWYCKYPILADIYYSEADFATAVSEAYHKLEYPEDHQSVIVPGDPFLEIEKIKIHVPEPRQSKLLAIFNRLKSDKSLFPHGFKYNPTIEWTHNIIATYFGIAYPGKGDNKIKINRILNSPDIEGNEELLRFVIYHEMLHFSVSFRHNKAFREVEDKFPNRLELDARLDRMYVDYEIKKIL